MPPSVTAMIVTYHRKVLLEECLQAVLAQTQKPDRVLVIDNSEDDETVEMMAERFPEIPVVRTGENWGCAGGFHDGLKREFGSGAEWFWLMDDDTIPEPDALEALLEPLGRLDGLPRPAILASKVNWTDGKMHLMNPPWPRWDPKGYAVDAAERRLLPMRACTYVSMLIHRDAVEKHGVPIKHWFIWGDDIEFTARVLRSEPGYFVPDSVVLHKTANNYNPALSSTPRFYYDVRNKLFMLRSTAWGPVEKFWLTLPLILGTKDYLTHNKFGRTALGIVLRGLRDGLLQSPGTAAQRSLTGSG